MKAGMRFADLVASRTFTVDIAWPVRPREIIARAPALHVAPETGDAYR